MSQLYQRLSQDAVSNIHCKKFLARTSTSVSRRPATDILRKLLVFGGHYVPVGVESAVLLSHCINPYTELAEAFFGMLPEDDGL